MIPNRTSKLRWLCVGRQLPNIVWSWYSMVRSSTGIGRCRRCRRRAGPEATRPCSIGDEGVRWTHLSELVKVYLESTAIVLVSLGETYLVAAKRRRRKRKYAPVEHLDCPLRVQLCREYYCTKSPRSAVLPESNISTHDSPRLTK